MKKLIASVGLAALGASTLHAQYSPGVTAAELQRPWSVGLSVRGFYDDNYLTLPNTYKRSTYGEEVSPSASMNYTHENTTLTLSYVYDMRYMQDQSTMDQSHQFNANLKQVFSERFSLQVNESFVDAQEPTVIDPAITSSPLFTSGDNMHNDGTISFNAGLTEKLGLQASYENNLYAYQQTYGDVYNPNDTALTPSRSALLDRIQQLGTVDLNYKFMNELTGLVGYSFGNTDYTSPEPISFYSDPAVPGYVETFNNPKNYFSKQRDSDSDFFFIGVDEQFGSQVNGSLRVGGQYLNYYHENVSDTSPYLDAKLTWTYMQASYLQGGVTLEHSATDVAGAVGAANEPVLDSETTAGYLSINQQVSGGLSAGAMGQFQHSVFNGGSENGQTENFFIFGMNLAYRFNPYFSAEGGYNWNKLVSDISGRDYTRNVVYIGVRATY